MNWIELKHEYQINEIIEKSQHKPQTIFKHSTKCSVSSMAKNRLERSDAPENTDFYYLDLISHRNISNIVAEAFSVFHESPQILVIKSGACVYDESHSAINMSEIEEQVGA